MTKTLLARVAMSAAGPAVICLLGLPATGPFWASTMPRSFDGMFHLFRLLEIDHLARQLVFFPRWAPDLLFGYGYPVFQFVPHLPYYLSDILHLAGLSLVHTILASFCLSLLGSGVAMYIFVRDIFGSRAAVLAAVAYMYAPFHLYDLLLRGHLPGAWSMVLFPLVLWSFRRLVRSGGAFYFVSSALLYAACFLSHNPANLIFTPFLLFYLACIVWSNKGHRAAGALRAGGTLAVAAGLAAFFWIPALWERQFIQVDRMITPPDLDFHGHFITVGDMLAPPPTADTGLMNPGVPNSLGLVLVSVSLVSIFRLRSLRTFEERAHLVIGWCALGAVIYMVLPQSAVLWENLPLLKYLVFPHRFLRLVTLIMALLCGAAARSFADSENTFSPSLVVTLVSSGMIIVSSLSLLYPPLQGALPLDPSFSDMMEFDRRTGTIGTTSFGEYLPIWVEWIPTTSPLEPLYASSASIERFEEARLPQGADITSAHYAPLSATIGLSSPQPFEATFDLLYYPGWTAYVDGREADIVPTPGQGLVSVMVPAGEHLVQLRFEDTAIRVVGKVLSGLSVLALLFPCVAKVLLPRISRRPASSRSINSTATSHPGSPGQVSFPQAVVLSIMAVAVLGAKLVVLDRHDTWFKRDFDGLHVAGAQNPLQINFADQTTLLGFDLSSPTLRSGDTLKLTLYWKARQQLNTDYSSFVHLVDEHLNIYAQMDSLNPGRYPTRLWEIDEYNRDSHEFVIPPGTPPGEYVLGVGLYDQTTMVRLSILEEEGHQAGMYFLRPLSVVPSARTPTLEELGIQHRVDVRFDNGMSLLGHSQERSYLLPGDFFRMALFWEAKAQMDENYSVVMRLLDSAGETVVSQVSEPSAGRYPTSVWEQGERVRDNHALRLPRDIPAGDYVVQLTVFDSKGREVPATAAPGTRVVDGWLELLSVGTAN